MITEPNRTTLDEACRNNQSARREFYLTIVLRGAANNKGKTEITNRFLEWYDQNPSDKTWGTKLIDLFYELNGHGAHYRYGQLPDKTLLEYLQSL